VTQIISLPLLLVWSYFKAAVMPLGFLYPYSIGATLGAICLAIGIIWALRVGGTGLRGLGLLILFVVVSPVLIWLGGSIGGATLSWIVIAICAAIILGGLTRIIVGAANSAPAVLVGVFILTLAVNSYFVATVALIHDLA
jgi:hypothetical protein